MPGLQGQCVAYINAIMEVNFQKLKHNGLLNGIDVQMYECVCVSIFI